MNTQKTLVLGATGGFGGGVALELLGRGRPVKALVRSRERALRLLGSHVNLELVEGDVQDVEALLWAAEGCGSIVHGINTELDQWDPLMRSATRNVIAVARGLGATILFPGDVLGLGNQTGRLLDESAPDDPCTRKGRLRVELENDLRAAAAGGAARVVVLRAGDYFGPTVRNPLIDMSFGNAAAGRPILMIGDLDIAHQWTYVPDLARAAVGLLDAPDRLGPFEIVHFAGYVAPRQRRFLELIAQEAGRPDLPIRKYPWYLLGTLGLIHSELGELREMRYLFDGSVILDEPRRRALLPGFVDTPIAEAVRATLRSYRSATWSRGTLDATTTHERRTAA